VKKLDLVGDDLIKFAARVSDLGTHFCFNASRAARKAPPMSSSRFVFGSRAHVGRHTGLRYFRAANEIASPSVPPNHDRRFPESNVVGVLHVTSSSSFHLNLQMLARIAAGQGHSEIIQMDDFPSLHVDEPLRF
jgi:hypothetical protein